MARVCSLLNKKYKKLTETSTQLLSEINRLLPDNFTISVTGRPHYIRQLVISPANNRRSADIVLMLGQRRRQWTKIKTTWA